MIQASAQSITNRALHLSEIDRLVDVNCKDSIVETTMRFRALTELSRLDSNALLALAHMLHQLSGPQRLMDLISANAHSEGVG